MAFRARPPHRPLPARGAVAAWVLFMLMVVASALALAQTPARRWQPLVGDGVHDPKAPGLPMLQEPAEALRPLPADTVGNQVRWMHALDRGEIQPRSNILPGTQVNLRTTEVLLKNTGEMPLVLFPHRQHTAWLDCTNCHDKLFSTVAGATKNNMMLILQGEKCGVCHGAVAFPLTECLRCHSVERGGPVHLDFGKLLVRERKP